jgi:hygromycin-B 4-O-kinase
MNEERAAAAVSIARHILKSQFGVNDAELTPKEGGLTNYVFEAATPAGPIVLRLGPSEKRTSDFAREHCVIDRVREAGIPAPEVLDQGEHDDWAYLILKWLPGRSATDHPKRLDILRESARLAATGIHLIRPIGYGHDFALEGQCSNGHLSWRAWLDEVLDASGRVARLRKHDIISDEQLKKLRDTLEEVRRWTGAPVLNHGDLRLKNLMVDDDGSIVAIIDWDSSVSVIGPHWDLSVALHDLNVDEEEAFLDGYGMRTEDVPKFAPVWRLFNAINYVPEVERLLRRRDQSGLERIRNRFRGALGLYVE